MPEMVSPAEQVTQVATLLGRAVLPWKREKEQSSEISEIVSDSLPKRLEFSPVSSLSVTGQNDEATGFEETSAKSETNTDNHVRGATNKDRGPDRRRMWTPQKVFEAIVNRRAEGFDLSATRYEDHGLFAAARARFGSWNKALVAAGIDAVLREQWDEEKVLVRIRQLLHEVPIKRIRRLDSKLTSAAERRFGSIHKAVEVALSQGNARNARKTQ